MSVPNTAEEWLECATTQINSLYRLFKEAGWQPDSSLLLGLDIARGQINEAVQAMRSNGPKGEAPRFKWVQTGMFTSPTGDWVRLSDYEAVLKQLDACEKGWAEDTASPCGPKGEAEHLRMQIGYIATELMIRGDPRSMPEIVEAAAKATAPTATNDGGAANGK